MERVSREQWAKRVERWSESGLTAAEFAAEIGVKEATLRHWKWALRRHATEPGWEAKAARERRQQHRAKFVELVAPPAVPPTPVEQLELVLRNGLQIRFPALVDSEALRRILDILETR